MSIKKLRFGPTPWTCCDCGIENEMSASQCKECGREPRRTLTDGRQIYPGHREIIEAGDRKGQQKDYVVLAEEERAKGFVRPVRDAYRNLKCGMITTMSRTLAETYARDPGFYSGTFCSTCGSHFPVGENGEFIWYENDGSQGPKVGT
jgi:hypothetical protein